MENHEIALALEEIGAILRVLQDDPKWSFKASAYERAGRAIQGYAERLEDIARAPDRKLMEVPGVGADLASKITELLTTGKIEYLEERLRKVPRGVLAMMQLQGVGPQKARVFHLELGIGTVAELEAAAKEGKIRKLKGMSEKTEQSILKAIEVLSRATGRFRLDIAQQTADEIALWIRKVKGVDRVTPAGSLRRGRDTIGDLDLVVTGGDPEELAEHLVKYPPIMQVLAKGRDKVSVKLANHMQVDVRLMPPESYGAALQYFTGSKEHNVALRERVRKRGWKLNEYGLYAGERVIAGSSEEQIYEKLDLEWIPPEMRENMGEIELAEAGELPKLVELADIRGDLQMHTTASDGRTSAEEMADAAKKLGYKYILITDHSKAVTIANGLDDQRALENIERIKAARRNVRGIEIWAGCEVDILAGGDLDYPDEILQQFDIVLASIHSRMTQPGEEMTNRIIRALENPYVRILGHPTGRYVLRRDPFQFDVERVFDAAKKNGVILEINANPERLDLCDRHVRLARDKGIKTVISTDAHRPAHFELMRYGVITARRGWMEKASVINTYSPAKLLESLRPLPQ